MSRRPLAPDLWEQALINGRRSHPGDDAAALQWAEQWYQAQGGMFDAPASPAALDDPPMPPENTLPEVELQALALSGDHEPGDAEPPAAKPAAKSKRRARHDDGQFKADDPATPAVDEAWEDSAA